MNHRANRQRVSSAHLDFDPSIVKRLTPSDAELPADLFNGLALTDQLRNAGKH